MFEKLRVIFTIPELRQKILLTLGLLAIYRVGWQVPLPIIDANVMNQFAKETGGIGELLRTVAVFSASQLSQATIFGLGIMPYISASIIFQLLGTVWPPLERLQKEGEAGRKKINEYTRYATVIICVVQSWAYVAFLASQRVGEQSLISPTFLVDGRLPLSWQFVAVMTMTAGTIFLMWLGEQIDEFGIGNGISLLIMAGILAGMPSALVELGSDTTWELGGGGGKMGVETLLVLAALFVGVVAGVVFMTQGQRRIPTQSAKHVRGRRVYGGTRQYLPLRVNQAGVMPIIFASSLLLFPQLLFQYLSNAFPTSDVLRALHDSFMRGQSHRSHLLLLLLLDRHHLQSQGDGRQSQELRSVHSRLPPGQADGRLSRAGDGAHYLRWGGLSLARRRNSHDRGRGAWNPSTDRQLLRWHWVADRRQRGLRPGAEN